MNDQCKHCSYRGDINSCQLSECSIHESWYAQQQQQTIDELCESLTLMTNMVSWAYGDDPLVDINKANMLIAKVEGKV